MTASVTTSVSELISSPRQAHSSVPDPTAFAAGGEFSVGAEEELLLVDTQDELISTETPGLIALLSTGSQPSGLVSAELFGAEIEFATAVCRSADGVRDCLGDLRSRLCRTGARPMAVGVHPAGTLGAVDLTRSARYDAIRDDLAGLLRTPTAALQVHVGMPDAATAMVAFRGLRHRLALLRALSAGSPYWHGRDSGLACARWAVLRSYPRSGTPPVVRDWEEYVALTEAVIEAADVPDYTQIWWDLRAQPRLGTLEVRVMDTQPSLDAVAGLAALVQGLARYAVERPVRADVPSAILDENDFRTARHGLETRIVDDDGVPRPVREIAARAVDEARSVLAPDGLDAPLSAIERILGTEPEYCRQRRIGARQGIAGVLRDLSARTAAGG
jgi:carboxylate-amine ligase